MSCLSPYAHLQQFQSIQEMDVFVKQIYVHFSNELNTTEKAVLDFLKRYSCVVKGVSRLKVETIAKGIHKSVRTVRNATKKLCELGIVDKLFTTREKRGGDGANIYLIKADCLGDCSAKIAVRENEPTPTETKEQSYQNVSETHFSKALFKSFKKIETHESHKIPVDKSVDKSVDKWEPKLFSDIPFMIRISLGRLQDNCFANGLWKKVIQAFVRSSLHRFLPYHTLQELCSLNEEFTKNLYVKIHNAIHTFKAGEIRDDFYGYLYVVTHKLFEETKKELECVESYTPQFPFYDWLTTDD